jgi:hypothetical protein
MTNATSDADENVRQKLTKVTDYWQALGYFVDEFARTEAQMQLALWRVAGVPDDIAKAIFSGTKIDAAIGFIRRIIEVRPIPDDKHKILESALVQLKAINDVRNLIVHYGAKFNHASDTLVASNRRSAHSERSLKEQPVSVQMLRNMALDLNKASVHLAAAAGVDSPFPKVLNHLFQSTLESAWLYTPPKSGQQTDCTPPDRESRKQAQALGRRRQPSRR